MLKSLTFFFLVFVVFESKLKDAEFIHQCESCHAVVLSYLVVKFLAALVGRRGHFQLLFLSSLVRKNDGSIQ